MPNLRRAPALWGRISRSGGWGSPVRGSLSAAVVSVAVSPVTMAQDGSSVNGGGVVTTEGASSSWLWRRPFGLVLAQAEAGTRMSVYHP